MNTPILTVPGLGGSGPLHWQTEWEQSLPNCRRVVQRDWDRPALSEWLSALGDAVSSCDRPPILVAHSLGCALVAHWVQRGGRRAHGALLVAPADVDSPRHTPPEVRSFAPMPLDACPFPAIVVASTDDPFASLERAELFSRAWGGRFLTLPNAGHINSDSGLENWPYGQRLLQELANAPSRSPGL